MPVQAEERVLHHVLGGAAVAQHDDGEPDQPHRVGLVERGHAGRRVGVGVRSAPRGRPRGCRQASATVGSTYPSCPRSRDTCRAIRLLARSGNSHPASRRTATPRWRITGALLREPHVASMRPSPWLSDALRVPGRAPRRGQWRHGGPPGGRGGERPTRWPRRRGRCTAGQGQRLRCKAEQDELHGDASDPHEAGDEGLAVPAPPPGIGHEARRDAGGHEADDEYPQRPLMHDRNHHQYTQNATTSTLIASWMLRAGKAERPMCPMMAHIGHQLPSRSVTARNDSGAPRPPTPIPIVSSSV